MNTTLYVFGDSFSDAYYEDRNNEKYFLDFKKKFISYISKLEKKYNVINFSKKGCSPFFVENLLLDVIDRYDISDSYCLVFSPTHMRYDWKYLNTTDTNLSTIRDNSSRDFKNNFIKLYGRKTFNWQKKFTDYNKNEIDIQKLHLISIIALTKKFKNSLIFQTESRNYGINNIDKLQQLVSDNQCFLDMPMEILYKKDTSNNKYPNHFDLNTHYYLYDAIDNYFENNVFDKKYHNRFIKSLGVTE
jgi:hypothetical protein